MPRISITEKDLSWYSRQRAVGPLIVAMPIIASWGPENAPVLVDDLNFVSTFGDKEIDSSNDISYCQAASFVKTGIGVLAFRVGCAGAAAARSISVHTAASEGVAAKGLNITISAKYKGTYGNELTISTKGSDNSSRTFIVKDKNGNTLETMVYNFADQSSPYWYTTSSQQSKFITVNAKVATTEEAPEDPASVLLALSAGVQLNSMNLGVADAANGVTTANLGLDCTAGTTPRAAADATLATDDGKSKFLQLSDNLMFDFDVLVSGGFTLAGGTGTTAYDLAKEIVETRKTSIYLYDDVKDVALDTYYQHCDKYNSSFVASYGPWCSARVISDGSTRDLPGSYVMLIAWGRAIANGANLWEAPAGVKRASVGSVVRDTVKPVTSAIVDSWQNDSLDYKVNPIAILKQYGYVIYGNSTLLHKDYSGNTSMLNAFSTRVVANLVKREAINVSLSLQFDQMSNDLFTEFRTLLGGYLDTLKYGNALYDYQILMDYSKLNLDNYNTRTIPVIIRISPNPAVENFDITLEISQAGVTFGDDSTTPYSQTNENIMG